VQSIFLSTAERICKRDGARVTGFALQCARVAFSQCITHAIVCRRFLDKRRQTACHLSNWSLLAMAVLVRTLHALVDFDRFKPRQKLTECNQIYLRLQQRSRIMLRCTRCLHP
jgi:hypothetical protein